MALTATANAAVIEDSIRAMGMRDPIYLHKQSFNRQNLRYSVRKKTGKVIQDIAELIKDRINQTGESVWIWFDIRRFLSILWFPPTPTSQPLSLIACYLTH